MDPIISTITWFECNKLSNTLQDSINGNFKNMIIPRKAKFGYAVLGPEVFRIFINFIDLGNPVTLKYKVWQLNSFRNLIYFKLSILTKVFRPLISEVKFTDGNLEILFVFSQRRYIEIQLEDKSSYENLKLIFDSLNQCYSKHETRFKNFVINNSQISYNENSGTGDSAYYQLIPIYKDSTYIGILHLNFIKIILKK